MLLETKFHIPTARTALVMRSRLLEKLQTGLTGKVTLVAAPAGFGKTTLVSEWLRTLDQETSVAWLSLDKSDNDPTQFWDYVVSAVHKVTGLIGRANPPTLPSSERSQPNAMITTLLNRVSTQQDPLLLTLDDYHLIDNPAIHDALARLIEQMPAQLHLVLITRTEPPLPLARLRVRRQINELRADDLRFSAGEVTNFLNQIMGLNLSPNQVAALEARTEGWVASLQLAALSLQNNRDPDQFIATFSGGHRHILDYLTEEALQQQPPDVRDFLLKTSILERLSAPLCDLLTGRSDGQRILTRLEQANLFLIPLDEHRQWYRYHHLFADLLRLLARTTIGDEGIAQLHSQAARWFAEEEQIEDAIHHAISAEDYQMVANLIETVDLLYENRGKLYTLVGWYKALPETVLHLRPKLTIRYAHKLMMTADDNVTEAMLNSPWLADVADRELQGEILLLRGFVALRRHQHDEALAYAQSGQALLSTASDFWAGTYGLQGQIYFEQGKLDAAETAYQQAAVLDENAGRISGAVDWWASLAMVYQAQNKTDKVEEAMQQSLKLVAGTAWPTEGNLYFQLAWTQGLIGEFTKAEVYLRKGIEIFRRIGEISGVRIGLLELAFLKRVQQNLPAAIMLWREAKQLPATPDHPWANIRQELTGIELAWLQGNLEPMQRWLQTKPGWQAEWPIDYKATCCQYQILLTIGGVLPTLPDQLFADLGELLTEGEAGNKVPFRILILTWHALAEAALKHFEQAFNHLQNAFDLAAPINHQLYFLEHGKPMAALIQQAVTSGVGGDFALKILQIFAQFEKNAQHEAAEYQPLEPTTSSTALALIEPLTAREQEVLSLIVTGLTNQEIAEKLVISIATVKRHISNLYGKLGVEHRTQAIARARELRLT